MHGIEGARKAKTQVDKVRFLPCHAVRSRVGDNNRQVREAAWSNFNLSNAFDSPLRKTIFPPHARATLRHTHRGRAPFKNLIAECQEFVVRCIISSWPPKLFGKRRTMQWAGVYYYVANACSPAIPSHQPLQDRTLETQSTANKEQFKTQ